MKQKTRLLLALTLLVVMPLVARSQVVIGGNEEYDFDYLTPKTYEIGGLTFEGAENFDTRVVQLVAGLQVGDRIKIPGDKISGAIENLWKQGMFDDVQIRVSRIQGNLAFLTIALRERPRMLKFAFSGVKKGEDKKPEETKTTETTVESVVEITTPTQTVDANAPIGVFVFSDHTGYRTWWDLFTKVYNIEIEGDNDARINILRQYNGAEEGYMPTSGTKIILPPIEIINGSIPLDGAEGSGEAAPADTTESTAEGEVQGEAAVGEGN